MVIKRIRCRKCHKLVAIADKDEIKVPCPGCGLIHKIKWNPKTERFQVVGFIIKKRN